MKESELRFEAMANNLLANKVASDPAEIHGILCGMLAGGMHMENKEWLGSMADFVNAGQPFSDEIEKLLLALFEDTCKQLQHPDFSFAMCIPEDGAPISERGQAVISWVQGFLLGFGVQQEQRKSCSEEVKEALQDFSEIAKMDAEMADTEEAEQALFEVTEYIRISVMLCYGELGQANSGDMSAFRTLH